MIVAVCEHANRRTNGKTESGATRYRCKDCGKSWTESTATLGGMRIPMDTAVRITEMLCEGTSASAAARMARVDIHTVIDLMVYVGERCETYMAENIKGVFCNEVQVDEIWQFVFCKNATAKKKKYVGGCGDSFCFTAIDRETKLLITWQFGRRNEKHTDAFIRKLDAATYGHFHISSDGWRSYPAATKIYGARFDEDLRRYSPARLIGSAKTPMMGTEWTEQICTSHVERMNGSIRTFCKRMGRLTYCFSKKWDNHRAALVLPEAPHPKGNDTSYGSRSRVGGVDSTPAFGKSISKLKLIYDL
jgi:transposase-like protein/IS1 family transposase